MKLGTSIAILMAILFPLFSSNKAFAQNNEHYRNIGVLYENKNLNNVMTEAETKLLSGAIGFSYYKELKHEKIDCTSMSYRTRIRFKGIENNSQTAYLEPSIKAGILQFGGYTLVDKYDQSYKSIDIIKPQLTFKVNFSKNTSLIASSNAIFADKKFDSGEFKVNWYYNKDIGKKWALDNNINFDFLTLNPNRYFFLDNAFIIDGKTGVSNKKFRFYGGYSYVQDDETSKQFTAGLSTNIAGLELNYEHSYSRNKDLNEDVVRVGSGLVKAVFGSRDKHPFFGVSLLLDNSNKLKDFYKLRGFNSSSSTPRKALESMENIQYGNGKIVPRTPAETQKNGSGDCDELADLLAYKIRSLGYDSYVVDYFVNNSEIGHSIALFKTKDNFFVVDDNKFYKINAPENTDLKDIVKEAFIQTGKSLSLPIYKGDAIEYYAWEVSKDPNQPYWKNGLKSYDNIEEEKSLFGLSERGVRTLMGNNF